MTCVQWENGKSVSTIDSAQATMAHDADTDSDLADSHVHPTASIHRRSTRLRLCYCGVLRASSTTAMLWRTRVPVTRGEATVERWMEAARTTRSSRRSGPAEDRAQAGGGPVREDRRRIRADDVYPECWRSIHLSDDGGEHSACERTLHVYPTYAHGPLRPSQSGIDSFLGQSDFKDVV